MTNFYIKTLKHSRVFISLRSSSAAVYFSEDLLRQIYFTQIYFHSFYIYTIINIYQIKVYFITFCVHHFDNNKHVIVLNYFEISDTVLSAVMDAGWSRSC